MHQKRLCTFATNSNLIIMEKLIKILKQFDQERTRRLNHWKEEALVEVALGNLG